MIPFQNIGKPIKVQEPSLSRHGYVRRRIHRLLVFAIHITPAQEVCAAGNPRPPMRITLMKRKITHLLISDVGCTVGRKCSALRYLERREAWICFLQVGRNVLDGTVIY